MAGGTPEGNRIFSAKYDDPDHFGCSVFFTQSQASQAAGRAFLKRFRLRTKDRDPEVNAKVRWRSARPSPNGPRRANALTTI